MFGRKIRTKLPYVPSARLDDGEIRDRDSISKEKGRAYADAKRNAQTSKIAVGDCVIAKRMRKENKLDSTFAPEEFEVIRKQGSDTIIRSNSTGKQFRRSVTHLKKLGIPCNPETDDKFGEDTRRKTTRARNEPSRYNDYIPH